MSRSADLISDVHWTKLALCAGHPERGWWFPEYYCDKDFARAVAICRACPVRTDCLNFAITTGQSEGVGGGTTPSERRQIRREVRRPQSTLFPTRGATSLRGRVADRSVAGSSQRP